MCIQNSVRQPHVLCIQPSMSFMYYIHQLIDNLDTFLLTSMQTMSEITRFCSLNTTTKAISDMTLGDLLISYKKALYSSTPFFYIIYYAVCKADAMFIFFFSLQVLYDKYKTLDKVYCTTFLQTFSNVYYVQSLVEFGQFFLRSVFYMPHYSQILIFFMKHISWFSFC